LGSASQRLRRFEELYKPVIVSDKLVSNNNNNNNTPE
jgi:hypothetical protein